MLDIGCGEGFESLRLAGRDRWVLGVDRDGGAGTAARRLGGDPASNGDPPPNGDPAPNGDPPSHGDRAQLRVAQMDALALGVADGTFDAVCSSHLIEHFNDPAPHAAEVARAVADDGTAFFLTPNAPCDFENPFHLHLFEPNELGRLLGRYFEDVWVGGVDGSARVKADFSARRAKAQRVLRLDVLDLRHRMPRRWYVWLYTRLLPLAYRLVARGDTGGATGITADDWFVTDDVDATTLVLFAVCRAPRRDIGAAEGRRWRAT